MSRCISTDRPSTLPIADRALRVFVLPGSMAYSAVSQPLPRPTRNGGTVSSTEQVQRTIVSPDCTRTLPGAWRVNPRWKLRGRS